jgi:(p)ppGpp synthase/HD superfamily hydrolase
MENENIYKNLKAAMANVSHLDVVQRAETFARFAHSSIEQVRSTGGDYFHHPKGVSETVAQYGGDPIQQAAGWLHDTAEDVGWVSTEILNEFFGDDGDLVPMVYELTDISGPQHGDRDARKAVDREHAAKASTRTKLVKLSDIHHNVSTIEDLPRPFARMYIKEKEKAHALLKTEGESFNNLYEAVGTLIKTKMFVLGIDADTV